MKTIVKMIAGTLLLTISMAVSADEARPGQADVDAIREQAMAQLREDNLTSLRPRIERGLVVALRAAAPRQLVAAGMASPGSAPDRLTSNSR